MKAAVLRELGSSPTYDDFPMPEAGEGATRVRVTAAGVHHIVLARASGRFYTEVPEVPHVVGTDGVGYTDDGTRVFFDEPVAPHGTWAEHTVVPIDRLMPVPPGIDDVTAAALGNTGLAAWTALSWRAQFKPGETVIVLGATGALGRVAWQAARALGAATVVAADLPSPALERLGEQPGIVAVPLGDDPDDFARRVLEVAPPADVVIDPLWGLPALGAIRASGHGARLIQLGQLAGVSLELAATDVRSRGMDVRGYALFHCPFEYRRSAYTALAEAVAAGSVQIEVEAVPLRDVAEACARQARGATGGKLVLVP